MNTLRARESLPSVGAELAREIGAARPFASIDKLSRVKGISAERLEQLRAELTVGGPTPPVPPQSLSPGATPNARP